MARLDEDVQQLELKKSQITTDNKANYKEIQADLALARQAVKVLEFRLKEKDQEMKMCILKTKELAKYMPKSKSERSKSALNEKDVKSRARSGIRDRKLTQDTQMTRAALMAKKARSSS